MAGEDMLEQLGLADREAHVAPFDGIAEEVAGGGIGDADGQPFDHQRGLVERVDQRALGQFEIGHEHSLSPSGRNRRSPPSQDEGAAFRAEGG